jgi:hypothetical protein
MTARNLSTDQNGKGGSCMGGCIPEKDYLDYIEDRLDVRRGFRLILHAVQCARCRGDVMAWPGLRRVIRRSERAGSGKQAGLAEDVMARIRMLPS